MHNHPKVDYTKLPPLIWMIYKHAQNHPKVDYTKHPSLEDLKGWVSILFSSCDCASLLDGYCCVSRHRSNSSKVVVIIVYVESK